MLEAALEVPTAATGVEARWEADAELAVTVWTAVQPALAGT